MFLCRHRIRWRTRITRLYHQTGTVGATQTLINKLAYIPEADVPKLFGAGETTCEPPAATRSTARPRSLVPSARNRKRPSMPEKPEGLVRTCGENRCGPWVFTR